MPEPSPKHDRIDWQDVPYVFVVLPTCPSCGWPSYTSTRSESAGDGASTIKAICRRCSEPFKICRELPQNGNQDS
jgi:hypothetical protein